MTRVTFEVPDQAAQAIAETPDAFACDMRLAAAMYWYGRGDITMGTAAAIAGLDLRDFLTALSERKQDVFVVDWDDLDQELAFLAGRRRQNEAGD